MNAIRHTAYDTRRAAQKEIAVWDLLVWAFRDECAQLDHPNDINEFERPGLSCLYTVAQIGLLGCQVDGGGSSPAHPDADIVAAQVAVLSDGCGGWPMATHIASYARAGVMPAWRMPCTVEPMGWNRNAHGSTAKTEVVDDSYRNAKGEAHKHLGRVCPLVVTGGPAAQASLRRDYLRWWGALFDIRTSLRIGSHLSAWSVSKDMPIREPWKKTS